MKRQTRGWGAYIAVVLVLVLLFMYLPGIMNQTDEVSNQVFREALEKDKITGATIEQNKEVPTGSVTFQTEDGDQ